MWTLCAAEIEVMFGTRLRKHLVKLPSQAFFQLPWPQIDTQVRSISLKSLTSVHSLSYIPPSTLSPHANTRSRDSLESARLIELISSRDNVLLMPQPRLKLNSNARSGG